MCQRVPRLAYTDLQVPRRGMSYLRVPRRRITILQAPRRACHIYECHAEPNINQANRADAAPRCARECHAGPIQIYNRHAEPNINQANRTDAAPRCARECHAGPIQICNRHAEPIFGGRPSYAPTYLLTGLDPLTAAPTYLNWPTALQHSFHTNVCIRN